MKLPADGFSLTMVSNSLVYLQQLPLTKYSGSIIVNVLLPKMRQFYKLEKKWKDGRQMDISQWLSGAASGEYEPETENVIDETQDPFWNDV